MATLPRLCPTVISSAARGNVNFTPGSYIWFGSLEFITGEGHDLDLAPPADKFPSFPKPAVDLQRCFDELKNTWPNEFSLPGLPQAAQPRCDKKVRSPSTNVYHLSPKASEVPDLPQQLRHAIADTLASIETSSNSDFLDSDYDDNNNDDYQGITGFAKLQKMQRFLRISDYLLNDEPYNDGFIDRFDGYELS
jgi:hypothetical protein